MKPSFLLVCLLAAATIGLRPFPVNAQAASPMNGVWTLNRSLSETPRGIGFNVGWTRRANGGGQTGGSAGGGRGRRGSSGGGGTRGSAPTFSGRRESSEDARRLQLLTAEVRNPPARLMVVDTATTFTITNELGQSRTLHPDGKEESIEVQGVPVAVTTRRDGDQLVVVYHVEQDRDLRYTFSHSVTPSQLVVDVQFLEHGAGDQTRHVYEHGVETRVPPASGAGTAAVPPNQPTP